MSDGEVLPVLPPGVEIVGRGHAGDWRVVDEHGLLRPGPAPDGWIVLGASPFPR